MRIAVVANYGLGLVKFRIELIERLIAEGHEVFIFYPIDEFRSKIEQTGAKVIDIPLSRHGLNVFKELALIYTIRKELKKNKINLALTFTIKPNIYVGIFKPREVKFIPNITGLGKTLENEGRSKRIFSLLYKLSLKKADHIFFQNSDNFNRFINYNIADRNKSEVLPGSGVNINKFRFESYGNLPKDITKFIFIGRLSKDKGINELLESYECIKSKQVHLTIVGIQEDEDIMQRIKRNNIDYYEKINDIRPLVKDSHCTILPSYHEGMSNVLLESAAIGRPLITTDIPGCKEIIDNNGILIEPKSVISLKEAMEEFMNLDCIKRSQMGINSRKHIEKNFNRKIIINKYLERIEEM